MFALKKKYCFNLSMFSFLALWCGHAFVFVYFVVVIVFCCNQLLVVIYCTSISLPAAQFLFFLPLDSREYKYSKNKKKRSLERAFAKKNIRTKRSIDPITGG